MVDIYEVDVSEETEEAIANIYEYLLENVSETTARKVAMGIANAIESLEKMPSGNPIQYNISSKERTFRFLLKWKYKIIFFVNEDSKTVKVIIVVDSSQHPDRLKDLF